jgi:hypothetical protein
MGKIAGFRWPEHEADHIGIHVLTSAEMNADLSHRFSAPLWRPIDTVKDNFIFRSLDVCQEFFATSIRCVGYSIRSFCFRQRSL